MALDITTEDEERLNSGFTQVYAKGWRRLRWLMIHKPRAASLYTWIAEHLDPDGGALVVSQAVMAEALGVSEITVRRLTAWMEEHAVMVRVKVGTGVYAYALDPEEIWKSWDKAKDVAVFKTRTLVKKRDRHNSQVARRIKTMLKADTEGLDPTEEGKDADS